MKLSQEEVEFLAKARVASMITLRRDGTPHAVRVGVALVDGKIWVSGIPERRRTAHVRRDAKGALFVVGEGYAYLTIEGRFSIVEGPDAAEKSVRLFEVMQFRRPDPNTLMWYGKALSRDRFLQTMREERRLIYELEPRRTYGLAEPVGGRA